MGSDKMQRYIRFLLYTFQKDLPQPRYTLSIFYKSHREIKSSVAPNFCLKKTRLGSKVAPI